MSTPICDFVRRYVGGGAVRMHMPGHKGCGPLGFEALDITEIDGADDLFHPEGIIAQSEENAGAIFGAHTLYATGGSTLCIQTMVHLLAVYARSRGQRPLLLAGRNAHKAFVNAAALLDVPVRWLCPAAGEAYYSGAVTPEQLEWELARSREPVTAVYLTCPDYLGELPDVAALATVCRRAGVLLAVDNAHGAYLKFLSPSRHPMDLGADLCCDSAHKTLPVVTGGAYLHIAHQAPELLHRQAKASMGLWGSSSPSYLILQSLDKCNQVLSEGYPLRLLQCCGYLTRLRRELNEAAAAKHCPGPLALESEPLKVTLDAATLGMTGTELAEALRSAKVECEYADPRYVVLMFTPANPPQDFERLTSAVLHIVENLTGPFPLPEKNDRELLELEHELHTCCSIRQAVFAPQETIPAGSALGRVCALPTVSCPPAIPIVVSGEVIGPAGAFRSLRRGDGLGGETGKI